MNNKIRKFNIFIDKTIGEFLFFIISSFYKPKKLDIRKINIKNILIIRPGGIGDFLLNIPAFNKIKESFPKAELSIILFKRNYRCLQIYNKFDKVIIIDNLNNFLEFIFGKKNYDLAIDFDQHRKIASLLAYLSKAKVKIGFKNNNKERLYDFYVKYSLDKYEAKNFLDLLKPLNLDINLKEKDLILIKKKKLLKNCIGIYATAMNEENRLPIKKWVKIINKLGKNKKYYFIGSKEDNNRYDSIHTLLKGFNIIRVDGKLSLKESFNLISKLPILLSEDGGGYHMAVCAGTPTISYWFKWLNKIKRWKAPFKKHKRVLIR